MMSPGSRVAFVIRDLELGGAESQLALLATELVRQGSTVLVVTLYAGGALEQELRTGGVDVSSVDKRRRWDVLGAFLRLVRLLRDFRPDIVHGYMTTANLASWAAVRALRTPRVVFGFRGSRRNWRDHDVIVRASTFLEHRLARRADLVIVNSTAGALRLHEAGIGREHIRVVPNGVDTARFSPNPWRRALERQTLGLPADGIVVGIVARLDPVKGVEVFLDAAARVASEDHRPLFLVVGASRDSAYAEQMRTKGRALADAGRLRWVGESCEMPAVYNVLDIAVSTSHSEGMSNAILEAMASGVPCVVTDVGDSREVVAETGLVVPPGDPAAVADAIRSLLDDDVRRSLGVAARRRAEDRYSATALARATTQALEALCAA